MHAPDRSTARLRLGLSRSCARTCDVEPCVVACLCGTGALKRLIAFEMSFVNRVRGCSCTRPTGRQRAYASGSLVRVRVRQGPSQSGAFVHARLSV